MAKKMINLRGAFGSALLTQRKRCGLSAAALGEILGVCTNTVSRWENEKVVPSPRTWAALLAWAEKEPAADIDQLKRAYSKAIIESGYTSRWDNE